MRAQVFSVTLISAVAQAAGIAKFWLAARLFGVGPEMDGYNLAVAIVTFLSGIVSGIVQTSLLPVRTHWSIKMSEEKMISIERAVLLAFALLGGVIGASLWLLQTVIESWVISEGSEKILQSFRSVWPFAWVLAGMGIFCEVLSYLLAARDRYVYAAAAQIANALTGILVLLIWGEVKGIKAMAMSSVAGLGVQTAICALALDKSGVLLIGKLPSLGESFRFLREVFQYGVAILPAMFFSNLLLVLPPTFLARQGEGAVAAFGYAQKLHLLAVHLLVMAYSPVILARLSNWEARGRDRDIRSLLHKSLVWSIVIGAFASLIVWFLGDDILASVFGGRFDEAAAMRVSRHWFLLTLGLAPAIFGNILAKLWQARKKASELSRLAGFGLVVFLSVCVMGEGALGEWVVSVGLTLSSFTVVVGFGWLSRRRQMSWIRR